MSAKHLITEVKIKLNHCMAFVKQIPKSHQASIYEKIQEIYADQDLSNTPLDNIETIYKKLDYRYRFLRLAYPSVPALETSDKYDIEELQKKYKELEKKKAEKIEAREKAEREKSQQEKGKTTLIYKDGEVKVGTHDPRVQSALSNWYSGNADPEDLKRHKEMIQRQYFDGPLWDGRPLPKSLQEIPSGQLMREGFENLEEMKAEAESESKDYLASGESKFEKIQR